MGHNLIIAGFVGFFLFFLCQPIPTDEAILHMSGNARYLAESGYFFFGLLAIGMAPFFVGGCYTKSYWHTHGLYKKFEQ
jgi:hypothetical protein